MLEPGPLGSRRAMIEAFYMGQPQYTGKEGL